MRKIIMKFIANKPAMLIGKTLIIADLHMGIECELGMECRVKNIIKETIKEIKQLLKDTRAKELIILGDVKHRITEKGSESETSELEWKIEQEIPSFLKEIENEGIKIKIIKGNHDGRLKMQAEDEIFLKEKSKKYCLIHGHKSPSPEALKSDFLIMGHVHPAVSFRDRLGMRTVKKIWIRGKFEKGIKERYPGANPNLKFIIMPAFNEFITGSSINETDLAGPLLKKEIFKITHAQLFLLNGVELDLKTLIRE